MRVIDVVPRTVREHQVDERAFFFGGFAVAGGFEPTRVAEGVLFLEVPLHAPELGLAVLTDEHRGDENGRNVARPGYGDAVLRLRPEDLPQRHRAILRWREAPDDRKG